MLSDNFAYPRLIEYFEELSAIPRASYHEEKIAEYLCDFARSRGLEYYRDEFNNVLINKVATHGCENIPPLLLQGHTDMVCEKNQGVEHDFSRDGLKLYESDGWIRAEGTTLGADNGVAVATMLYVLDGGVARHGALQCLFTASEEVGLEGAKSFDYSRIFARRMINMDSADESLVIASCAGGQRSSLTFDVEAEEIFATAILRITVKGLFGGHSGEDIDKGRANANKLMGRALDAVIDEHTRIVSIYGGTKDNAIPRECVALVATDDAYTVNERIENMREALSDGLCAEDSGFSLVCELVSQNTCVSVPDKKTIDKVIFVMLTAANGIYEMNNAVEGIVEWSRNLGIVSVNDMGAELVFSSRSSFASRIDASASELDAYARILGGDIRHYNRYPSWKFAEHSRLQEDYKRAYSSIFENEPCITGIHAGLECGFISEAIPDMDIISCGPVVLDLHSPDERLDNASFERFFSVVKAVIEQ